MSTCSLYKQVWLKSTIVLVGLGCIKTVNNCRKCSKYIYGRIRYVYVKLSLAAQHAHPWRSPSNLASLSL